MAKFKVDIGPSEVFVAVDGKAGINNSTLATYLVREAKDAVDDLNVLYGSDIQLDQISIDDDGVVVINNEIFRKRVRSWITNPVVPVAGWGCINVLCEIF